MHYRVLMRINDEWQEDFIWKNVQKQHGMDCSSTGTADQYDILAAYFNKPRIKIAVLQINSNNRAKTQNVRK